jgi:hypothetical protein
MNPANQYRGLAAELEAKARTELSPDLRTEWMHLAMGYRRLAQQADRNSLTDVVYEPAWGSSRRKDDGEAGTTA